MFFRKEPSKAEVLNDFDGELVNFWRVIQHHLPEFMCYFEWILVSREHFETENKRDLRRRITFRDVADALEAVTGTSWEEVLQRYGDPVKWVVLRAARRYTGLTLAELGTVAGGMDYAALGMALRRLERKLPGSPDLQQLDAQMAEMLDVKT